ncbi:unnamed protein product [Adineta steineri]|uniref:PLAT domain-containing protein n=1 Tax=Adineta steineri TaxID=433720 RepID=A0A815JWR0_9BILA|nr:unnamed protein product [Adineta steineri]
MVKKDDEVSVSSETKGPLKSFQALMGEGEKFSRDKLYTKAIQSYTEALSLLPIDDDKSTAKDINDRLNGLVARSACYLKTGKNNLALQDAEESLKSNKEFTKGLYQKAEALYAMGEFELALMFYHRGKKLRGDLREFQLGINKAQEAIDNSVGDPNRVKLEASGDLSIFYKNEEKKKQPVGYVRASQKKDTTVQRKPHPPPANPKTTKQLLGDLYEDRCFLDKIVNNSTVTKQNTKSGDAIYQLASDGIDYLDNRTHFWRQQEPLYARSKGSKKPESDDEIYNYIHRELEAIDEQQNMDQFGDARRRAHRLLDFCEKLDENKFPEKQSVLADVYSRLGNAYLELGDYNKALDYHFRDLTIAEKKHYTDRSSRALDNLGRVYARSGQFAQAIQVWERKIPLASSPLEKAWLFHEIGQCHFGLGDYERSKRYGERSYVEAVAVNDPVWQLNAKVLVAHSQAKLRQYREAEQTFEEALTLARDQHDMAAERAIERALKDVRDQIAKGAADSPPDRPETTYEIKIKSDDTIEYSDEDKGAVQLTIYGADGSSGSIDLRNDEKKFDGQSTTLKKKAIDAGKATKLALTCSKIDSWPLDSIEISDSTRKSKQKFLLAQPIDSNTSTIDLYPEGSIVKFPFDTQQQPARKNKPKSAQGATANDANKPAQYLVSVKTGSAMGSGTDAHVFITLNGDKQKITRHQLDVPESGRNAFEKNSKDDFKFTDVDVGQLKTITLEHDNSGAASGWFVDFVEVTVNGKTTKFPVSRWLDADEDDKRISLELEPNKKPGSMAQADKSKNANNVDYEVTVKTGDKRGAGTDANIYLSIYGDKGKIERNQLKEPMEHTVNKFEADATNRFKINGADLGKIQRAHIEHDGTGIGSGWYLDWIEIRDIANKITYKFPVDRWLDRGEGDKRIALDLEPDKKPGQLGAPKTPDTTVSQQSSKAQPKPTTSDSNKKVSYLVSVKTGPEMGSGTDAKVFITLNGDKQKVSRHQLDVPESGRNPFEKNNKDDYKFDEVDVGQLKTIILEHDNSGLASGWFVDFVEVTFNGNTTRFPVGRWLDKDEDDKRISLELEPNKKPASKSNNASKNPNAIEYEVTVTTAKKRGAGTDANVYLSIFGDKAKIEKNQLKETVDRSMNKFESGSVDKFQLYETDVGKIKTIRIEHDGAGMGAGWYVDSIEIRIVPRNEIYKFPIDRWLDSGEGDKRISLDLEPDKKPGQLEAQAKPATSDTNKTQPKSTTSDTNKNNASDPNKQTAYLVTVKTGSALGAGTDANVFITLNGDKQKIARHQLAKPESKRNPYERNSKDDFKFNEVDVGQLKTVILEHDNSAASSGWFVDFVEVTYNGTTTKFPVDRWLDVEEDDKQISLELEPNKKPGSKKTKGGKDAPKTPTPAETDKKPAQAGGSKTPDTSTTQQPAKAQTQPAASDPNKKTAYLVTVKTGSALGAGTDANVFITLNGDKQKIARHQLAKPESKRNPYERNSKDDFKFNEVDVGQLKTVILEHDNSAASSGWFVDFVEVTYNGTTTKFPVDRWLDVEEDDKQISLELEPNKKPGSKKTKGGKDAPKTQGGVQYDVTVTTAKKRGAGTDANVYLSIFGDKDKIERSHLKETVNSSMNLFESGSVDRFSINGVDVGKIQTIRIAHDGTGMGAGWYLDSVEVRHVSRNEISKFPVDRWLDAGEGDKKISLDLEPDKKPGQGKSDDDTSDEENEGNIEDEKVNFDEKQQHKA